MEIFTDVNMVRWLLSVLVLTLLLGGFAVIAPHIAKRRNTMKRKGKKKKLNLLETLHIDSKRRVVLLKAGNVEHTILTGPHEDVHLYAEPVEKVAEEEEIDVPIGFLKEIVSKAEISTAKKSKKKGKKK
jgi:hypothetical protein